MGDFLKIFVCICICVFSLAVNGQNLIENVDDITADNSVVGMPLKCEYDLLTGDHICDCHNRNAVRRMINHNLLERFSMCLVLQISKFKRIVYFTAVHTTPAARQFE